jgi:hypothetical protein
MLLKMEKLDPWCYVLGCLQGEAWMLMNDIIVPRHRRDTYHDT